MRYMLHIDRNTKQSERGAWDPTGVASSGVETSFECRQDIFFGEWIL